VQDAVDVDDGLGRKSLTVALWLPAAPEPGKRRAGRVDRDAAGIHQLGCLGVWVGQISEYGKSRVNEITFL
jgi:hypothetical protein